MTLSAPPSDTEPRLPGAIPARRNWLVRYLLRFDEGSVVRSTFFGMLLGTAGVLGLDLHDLSKGNGWWQQPQSANSTRFDPMLPPADPTSSPVPSSDPRRHVIADETLLSQPMRFVLGSGGLLSAEGTILPGTATRFAAELDARGEYTRTLSLNSPGGSLDDAMAMAVLVRDKGISTEVPDGALCASSCPLLFAGGLTRVAGEKAAVGVHQFYAASQTAAGPAQAMSDAQATTARISRHLSDMGVDPTLWLHALETQPRALYYFSPEELSQYRLVTPPLAAAMR